jgi:dynein heavy chain
MEAIMILLGEKIDWNNIKSCLGETNTFIDRLKGFDVMRCPEASFTKLRNNYLNKPEFDIQDIKKKSVAASFMASWVKAVNNYQKVVKVVEPKQKRYNEVKAILDKAERELAEKMGEVQKVRDKVALLQAQCNEMETEK